MTQEDKAYKNVIDALEPEQPSMRFTKNVMDAIGAKEVVPVGKHAVNPWVIKSIAAVLVLCILISLYMVFTFANTLPDYTASISTTQLPEHFSKYILGINIVLLLVLAERCLSSKRRIKDLQNNA